MKQNYNKKKKWPWENKINDLKFNLKDDAH